MYYLSEICCTCLKKSDVLINLTNKDSDGMSFADKFKMCAFNFIFHNLKTNQPLYICHSCCDNLKITYNFRKRSMKMTKTYREYISQLSSVTQEFPNSYFDVNIEISNCDVEKCYSMSKNRDNSPITSNNDNNNSLLNSENQMKPECDIESTSNVNDNLKVDLHTFENKYCNLLNTMTDTNEQLPVTYSNTVGLEESPVSSDYEPYDNPIERMYKTLDEEYQSMLEEEARMKRNIDISVDNPETFSTTVDEYDEQLANFDFETFSEMQQNAERSGNLKNNVPSTVTSANAAFKHYSKTGTKKPKHKYMQYCKICNKFLSSDIQRHLLIHSGEKRYKCQECDRAFIRSDHLKNHIRRWHKNERMSEKKSVPYKCFECGKIFNSKKSVTIHMRIHRNYVRQTMQSQSNEA